MFNDKGGEKRKIAKASRNPEHDWISRDPNIMNIQLKIQSGWLKW